MPRPCAEFKQNGTEPDLRCLKTDTARQEKTEGPKPPGPDTVTVETQEEPVTGRGATHFHFQNVMERAHCSPVPHQGQRGVR